MSWILISTSFYVHSKSSIVKVTEKLKSIEFDHLVWSKELITSLAEIKVYEKRLLEMIEQYAQDDDEKQMDRLLNGFIIQKETANSLLIEIKGHMLGMIEKMRSNGHLESMVDSIHQNSRESMSLFRQTHAELKERFHLFNSFQD